ncbi:MAG: penicillin acylase family protein [Balneolaceae bacterium]
MKTLLRFGLFILLLLIGFTALAVYWTFYKPLPDYTATLHLEGLQQPVDIHWDPYGVPHIYAQNEQDLYFSVGYVHAQDRLWQLTFKQLAAEGRFAEFLGEDLIEFDKYQRTLGFWDTARKIEEEAPPEIQRILQAYSDGINRYVENNRNNLPIEFTLLDIEPIPWTPTHSYALSRLMAWEMNVSWWSELAFAYLGATLPENVMQELYPSYSDIYPTTMNDEQSRQFVESLMPMIETEFDLRQIYQRKGNSVGSNAWAIDGSRTSTGLPLLAGDPHMGLDMPGNWYEVHLNLNGKNLSGGTLTGSPVVVVGQNDEIAWSLTNMMADDTDFFIEQIDPNDRSRYVVDSLNGEAMYQPINWRDEILRIKDSDDQLYRIRNTRHGPVISDIYPNESILGNRSVTMKWTGHQVSHETWALYQINWAESLQEFQHALSQYETPGQNFIYADLSGNIALFSAAKLPVREYHPLLFRNGWDPSYDWHGWIPFEDMPRTVNPPSGWVGNANNKLHTDSYPYYIATFWEPPSRIERIVEYMTENDTLDVEIFQQMQTDNYSIHAREITDIILPVLRRSREEYDFSQIIPYLENWDFRYSLNSTAASLIDAFFIELSRNTLLDELGEDAYRNFIRKENVPVQTLSRLLQENSFLFNHIETEETEIRNDIIRQSMQEAVQWLTDRFGEEPFQWRWENLHSITFRPPLFAEASQDPEATVLLKMIVNNLMSKGPYSVPGHNMTLNKGQYDWQDPFDMILGPSIRRIVDFSSLNRTFSVIPTGQSGNPISDFFGDQTELWLNGQYRYLYQDSTFFREVSYKTLQLLPEN